LAAEASELRILLGRAIETGWRQGPAGPQLPIVAGSSVLHNDAPYRSRPESYDENRVWHELLHSGITDEQTVRRIVDGAAARGETMLGIVGNRTLAVGFTAHGVAYGLLQHDFIDEFLLMYYAHAAHLHTRGTWTAVECADMDRDRAQHWPYCAPAQMTIPLLTKWMLLFEDPLADIVTLAKGTPRAWLESGKRIGVTGAPTRFGPVSYSIISDLAHGAVRADVSLPQGWMPAFSCD